MGGDSSILPANKIMNKTFFPQEHILKLWINDEKIVTLICTDAALPELITGYLLNERVISSADELASIRIDSDHSTAQVQLRSQLVFTSAGVRASGYGGMQVRADCAVPYKPFMHTYSLSFIQHMADVMSEMAVMYAQTGGMHCSALIGENRILSCFEDIGRHNTLDKISGDCMLRHIDASDCVLITSGRISSDMIRKAGMIGASVIASYSTPTQMACSAAEKANMSVIAYLKKEPSICCGSARITS